MILLTVFFVINLVDCVQPDALSLSIAGMENLISREKLLIDNLELYLGALERKADVIRSNLKLLRAENEKAQLEGDTYLINPLQAFSLLRRMHSDWLHWKLYLHKSIGEEYVYQITYELQTLPSEDEFNEAADAMFRLQDIYELDPAEMSVGKLNGVQYDVSLSAIDCFSIGYRLHARKKYEQATMWLQLALKLFNNRDSLNDVLKFTMGKILYFYVQTLAKQDKLTDAVQLLDHLITKDPSYSKNIIQKILLDKEIETKKNLFQMKPKIKPVDPLKLAYQMGCQGKFPQRTENLHCVYNSTTDPFLKLAPLKLEQISLDPYIVLYHDVVSDFEIEILQAMARPNLERAKVYNETEKKTVPASTRTSKLAWFPVDSHDVILRIHKRLADMTGFDVHMSEDLQVMNYGIGGHYVPHYDFFNVSSNNQIVQVLGDRVATAMFYLSDVQQGGATVFPNIELAVDPKKGACIFWHNLNPRGEGDLDTLHAACPVIVGSKWVSNKFISEKEQIFRRPCPHK